MQSYLSNRHYHALTQLLPECLRMDQPQKIYYKTFMNIEALKLYEQCKKTTYRDLSIETYEGCSKKMKKNNAVENEKQNRNSNEGLNSRKNNKNKQKKNTYNCCPLCFQTHISVMYHGHRHICVKCRNFVRDQHGNQIKIFLDEKGEIVCLGILPKSFERQKVGYYTTDHTKLEVNNTGVYASYAGEDQLVLILKDQKIR